MVRQLISKILCKIFGFWFLFSTSTTGHIKTHASKSMDFPQVEVWRNRKADRAWTTLVLPLQNPTASVLAASPTTY